MKNLSNLLDTFLFQAKDSGLKTAHYPRKWSDLKTRVSFGMGTPSHVPWIAFIAPEMQVRRGFYPVFLFYKELQILILAYGISETEEFEKTWPVEVMNSTETIFTHLDQPVSRYGDSFVFKSYKIIFEKDIINYTSLKSGELVTKEDLESDLSIILEYYKKTLSLNITNLSSGLGQGLFYMEKQLEDFLIHNWSKTELGKKYDLIVEEGDLVSQQYRTDIGPIDILVKDKINKNYVVIELKKNQTSDDTVGQVARYMGWVSENLKDKNVKGIIIAGSYDKKLDYALKIVNGVEVFLYEVDFKLNEFRGIK